MLTSQCMISTATWNYDFKQCTCMYLDIIAQSGNSPFPSSPKPLHRGLNEILFSYESMNIKTCFEEEV